MNRLEDIVVGSQWVQVNSKELVTVTYVKDLHVRYKDNTGCVGYRPKEWFLSFYDLLEDETTECDLVVGSEWLLKDDHDFTCHITNIESSGVIRTDIPSRNNKYDFAGGFINAQLFLKLFEPISQATVKKNSPLESIVNIDCGNFGDKLSKQAIYIEPEKPIVFECKNHFNLPDQIEAYQKNNQSIYRTISPKCDWYGELESNQPPNFNPEEFTKDCDAAADDIKLLMNSIKEKQHEKLSLNDKPQPSTKAWDICQQAIDTMAERGKTYDKDDKQAERSMTKTTQIFNILRDGRTDLTEEDGWMFMAALKLVRSQAGEYKHDNYLDMVAYAALMGEAAAIERH